MFPLPSPPHTHVVRQLECVSCRENFAVAASDPNARKQPGDHHVLPDSMAVTQMRYAPQRSQRAVIPETRSAPQSPAQDNQVKNEHCYINCPRCGADNRNWLQLLSPDVAAGPTNRPGPLMNYWLEAKTEQKVPVILLGIVLAILIFVIMGTILDSFLHGFLLTLVVTLGSLSYLRFTQASFFVRWRSRFPLANASLTVGLILGIIDFGFALTLDVAFNKALIIGVACVLFAGLIAQSLTGDLWIELRINQYLRQVQPTAPNQEQRLWLSGSISTLIFSLIIPLVFFGLFPWASSSFSEWLATSAADDISATVQVGDQSTTIVIDGTNPELLEKRRGMIDDAIKQAGLDKRFFVLWAGGVGLSCLFAVILSMRALLAFTDAADRQLPPPLFYSLANMTRVVAWEAKKALEIPGDLSHIQWLRASRNDDGGINLVGIHAAETAVTPPTESTLRYTPAQEYTITTDAWGYIIEASIKPTRTPVTPTPTPSSGNQIEVDFFKQVPSSAAANVRLNQE